MKRYSILAAVVAVLAALTSCHEIEEYADDPRGNFEQMWSILDEHYCFFEQKDIDWDEVHARYSTRISDQMKPRELFNVCADMLAELRDGHTNLSAPFDVSYYREWWSLYPQNYDQRLVEQYYLNFNYHTTGSIVYDILPENVAYMRYGSFSNAIGDGNLDEVLAYLATAAAMVIDVRDNGGGSITNVETLVRRFISTRMLAGSICHKNGPGRNDFSEPHDFYFETAPEGRMCWGKPVVVLCNRSTFSAANNFVSIMKYVPGVTIVGATTGGGSGMPFSSELPNGWGVRFSASPVRDPEGHLTEFGVEPSEGCAVDLDPVKALDGHDTMLDFAIKKALESC